MDNMSVHAARALIGWSTSSRSCHNYCVSLWKGMRTMSLLGFALSQCTQRRTEASCPPATPWCTLQSAAEATVDIHCKTVFFNTFGDINIFTIVLSKKDNFCNV